MKGIVTASNIPSVVVNSFASLFLAEQACVSPLSKRDTFSPVFKARVECSHLFKINFCGKRLN